jgi:hypothetical protein
MTELYTSLRKIYKHIGESEVFAPKSTVDLQENLALLVTNLLDEGLISQEDYDKITSITDKIEYIYKLLTLR